MTRYTIITEAELHADDMLVGTFRAQIAFDWVGDTCDGWTEPHYADTAELVSVKQVGGDWLNQKQLDAWASEWLAQLDDLDAILDKDRSTWDEQVAALKANYARQGVALAVGADA